MRPLPSRWLLSACLATALAFSACGDGDSTGHPNGAAGTLEGTLTVFAASSLAEAFEDIADAFTAANPGVDIEFNFAASSALAAQINERAPADVFASADGAQMRVVTDAGNGSREPVVFATNRPVVIAPPDSAAVARFEDLADPGIALVLAGENVPIGRYAREILAKASATGGISADFAQNVLANLRSDEANVRAVLTKIQLGEADAGIVYETDARVAGSDVVRVEIPDAYNVRAEYPIVTLAESDNPTTAAAFVAFVLSTQGQAILAEHGLGAPLP